MALSINIYIASICIISNGCRGSDVFSNTFHKQRIYLTNTTVVSLVLSVLVLFVFLFSDVCFPL